LAGEASGKGKKINELPPREEEGVAAKGGARYFYRAFMAGTSTDPTDQPRPSLFGKERGGVRIGDARKKTRQREVPRLSKAFGEAVSVAAGDKKG